MAATGSATPNRNDLGPIGGQDKKENRQTKFGHRG